MAQLAFQNAFSPAVVGMLADNYDNDIVSRANADSINLPVGRFVAKGNGDYDVVALVSSSVDIQGITIAVATADYDPTTLLAANGPAAYLPKAPVNVLRDGRCWVFTEQACTPSSPVFVRYANGTSATTTRGTIRIDADGAGAVQVRGAKFLTSAAAGALVQIQFNKMASDAAALP